MEDADVGLTGRVLRQELDSLTLAEVGDKVGTFGIGDGEEVGRGTGGESRDIDEDVRGRIVVDVDAEDVGRGRDLNLRRGGAEGEVLEERGGVGRVGHIPDVDLGQDARGVDRADADVAGADSLGRLVETERRNRAVVVVGHERVGRVSCVGERGDGKRCITGRACAITEDVEGVVASRNLKEGRAEAVGERIHHERVARVDVHAGSRRRVGEVGGVEDADAGRRSGRVFARTRVAAGVRAGVFARARARVATGVGARVCGGLLLVVAAACSHREQREERHRTGECHKSILSHFQASARIGANFGPVVYCSSMHQTRQSCA